LEYILRHLNIINKTLKACKINLFGEVMKMKRVIGAALAVLILITGSLVSFAGSGSGDDECYLEVPDYQGCQVSMPDFGIGEVYSVNESGDAVIDVYCFIQPTEIQAGANLTHYIGSSDGNKYIPRLTLTNQTTCPVEFVMKNITASNGGEILKVGVTYDGETVYHDGTEGYVAAKLPPRGEKVIELDVIQKQDIKDGEMVQYAVGLGVQLMDEDYVD
jgi:hypothetical protein